MARKKNLHKGIRGWPKGTERSPEQFEKGWETRRKKAEQAAIDREIAETIIDRFRNLDDLTQLLKTEPRLVKLLKTEPEQCQS
jgi:translation initiation factor 2 beta subunit (eIF-2beta)/eIF-5